MNTDQAIQAHVDAFVRDLTAMIRESALDTVRAALGETVTKKRGPGRPRGSRSSTTTTTPRRRKGKRIRRSSEDVEGLGAEIVSYVQANDGCSIADIGAAVRATTKDLRLPVQKLLADRAIKTSGQKRGTKYHAGGSGRPTRKKGGRKKAAKRKTTKRRGKKKVVRKTRGKAA